MIDLGTNQSEPTSECGLGNRENPSETTTPLPSPQYGKSQSSKICYTFCWLNFSDFPYLEAPDEKSEKLSESYLVAPDEKSEKLSQQKVLLTSVASAFPYCGLGRGVMGSEGFSRFPSPHSLVGSDGFVPVSIVPTVSLHITSAHALKCHTHIIFVCIKSHSHTHIHNGTVKCHFSSPLRMLWSVGLSLFI